jgi:hypothetical protein
MKRFKEMLQTDKMVRIFNFSAGMEIIWIERICGFNVVINMLFEIYYSSICLLWDPSISQLEAYVLWYVIICGWVIYSVALDLYAGFTLKKMRMWMPAIFLHGLDFRCFRHTLHVKCSRLSDLKGLLSWYHKRL